MCLMISPDTLFVIAPLKMLLVTLVAENLGKVMSAELVAASFIISRIVQLQVSPTHRGEGHPKKSLVSPVESCCQPFTHLFLLSHRMLVLFVQP